MSTRIALYIGNSLYPNASTDPSGTIKILQNSPLTSAIMSLLNHDSTTNELVYNDGGNPVFNIKGDYIGPDNWHKTISNLRGGNIKEVYLSFSTNGTQYLNDLIGTNPQAACNILSYIKNKLGFDGIDLDYEAGNYGPGSPIYIMGKAAVKEGLKLTAAPYGSKTDWSNWVNYIQSIKGTVSWLNLQCYAGGKSINPGDWLDIGIPIVAGSCKSCASPQTTCSASDMQDLFTLWRTGKGSVTTACWWGTPNTQPQAIGGGFIWVYSAIVNDYMNYMNALKTGLGM